MKIDKKELRSIPNILSFIRIASVPVFMFLIIYGGVKLRESFIYIGLAVFLFAASTDVFDGYIARKYNQVTELGKFLDPFSDKMMHVGVLLSLVIIGYVHWLFIALLALKELTMVLCGLFLINNKVVLQANSMGKIASAMLSVGVIIAFFHPYVHYVDWAVLGIGLLLTYMAFVNYGIDALKDFKRIKDEKKNGQENIEQPKEEQAKIEVIEKDPKTIQAEDTTKIEKEKTEEKEGEVNE